MIVYLLDWIYWDLKMISAIFVIKMWEIHLFQIYFYISYVVFYIDIYDRPIEKTKEDCSDI